VHKAHIGTSGAVRARCIVPGSCTSRSILSLAVEVFPRFLGGWDPVKQVERKESMTNRVQIR